MAGLLLSEKTGRQPRTSFFQYANTVTAVRHVAFAVATPLISQGHNKQPELHAAAC